MIDVKVYWKRVDDALLEKGITMTEMANALGYKRETIYGQKRRNQFPKVKQMRDMERFLGIKPLAEPEPEEKKSRFLEFVPYLEKAEDWKIKAIRELLGMPLEKNETKVS